MVNKSHGYLLTILHDLAVVLAGLMFCLCVNSTTQSYNANAMKIDKNYTLVRQSKK